MARKKAWTEKKRRAAADKGVATRKKREQIIEQAHQSDATGYALLIPFGIWLKDSMKLKERIEPMVSLTKGSNSLFSVPDVRVGMVLAMEAGVGHGSHLDRLVPEVGLAQSIGLPYFFGATTATDVLKKARPRHIRQRQQVVRRICMESLASDDPPAVDMVVDTSGHPSDSHVREQVQPGYWDGQKQPCLKSGRVIVNDRPAWVEVYPGNENPGQPFDKGLALARWLCQRYPDRPVHFSADAGFASDQPLRQLLALERRSPHFRYTLCIPTAPVNSRPRRTVALATTNPPTQWNKINDTTRLIDLGYRKVYDCSQHRTRQIVVEKTEEKTRRHAAPARGHATKVQTHRSYLIATNHSRPQMKPQQVFGRYHRRTAVESSIKDGKSSFTLTHLPHLKFEANRLSLILATLAPWLGLIYHRRRRPPNHPRQTGPLIATLRADLWKLPGHVIDATHMVLHLVYRRFTMIQKICTAVQLLFGISIVFPGFNSSYQHRADGARACWGEAPPKALKWHQAKGKILLQKDGAKRVLQSLKQLRAPTEAARPVIDSTISYIQNHLWRMKYFEYRQRGFHIGSGLAEAACKHVVGARFKQSGMTNWTVPGAEAVLRVRVVIKNGTFDRYCDDLWHQRFAKAA